MYAKYRHLLPYIFIVVISYWAIKPLLINGYFPMHDDTQPLRVFSLAGELKNGIFPVRMVGNLGYGYGYPLFNFYAPLPYYIGGLLYLSGFDLIIATKYMFAVGIILSAIFMYKFAKEFAGTLYGLVCSVFYVYAPYHAVNIYIRGAVGEYFAYAFLPLFSLSIYRLLNGKRNFLFPGVLGLSGIFLSHNILALICFYFSIFILIILLISKSFGKVSIVELKKYLIVILISLGLSAFFLIPAFAEKNFTKISQLNIGTNNYKHHFIYLYQLWDSPWGFGGSTAGINDGMSFKVGKVHLISAFAALIFGFYLIYMKKINKNYKLIILSSTALFFLSVIFMISISDPVYKIIPFLDFIQYPWRFLNLSVFAFSIMIFTFKFLRNIYLRNLLAVFLIILVIFINRKYFDVKYIYPLTGNYYLSSAENIFKVAKISDEYLPPDLTAPQSYSDIRPSENNHDYLKVRSQFDSVTYKSLSINLLWNSKYQTNVAFFPGWEIKDNGSVINYYDENGFITFNLNKGIHNIELQFKNTPVRTFSNAISFFSVILILYLAIVNQNIWLKKRQLK